ncbi:hypothetical protein BJX61DRAFT_492752 [Aspergillus egyptiacus]|nr:hypothetical protein BJX61DRAFT_492752 [Aspergillus egyptiacus]
MALPPIAKATLQAALISAGSNVVAQGITSYRDEIPFELDPQALYQFTTSALILSPLTFLWLEGLESRFPSVDTQPPKTEKENAKPKRNWRNTVTKIVVDQVVGGAWNTVAFIATMGFLRGQDYEVIKGQIENDFWGLFLAGLRLWPFVSILNFTVVPADKRLLVGNVFGFAWAIYLSLMSA